MRFEKGCEILWQDRKRYFGLPISFYRYYLVKKEGQWVKFYRHKGFLTAIIHETNVYRCYDVSLHQSLGDKIFKTGTIEVCSNDALSPLFHLRHIKNPYEVLAKISGIIEEERKKNHVGIAEIR